MISLLVTVGAGFVAQTLLIRNVNEYGARLGASAWLHNAGEQTLPVFFAQLASSLETLAHARATGPAMSGAFASAGAEAFEAILHDAGGEERWSGLRDDGTPFTKVVPFCERAALGKALAAPGRSVTLYCRGLPVLAVAARMALGDRGGWLLAERPLDAWFVQALAKCTGPEVALLGPGGHLIGNARSHTGGEARVTLSPTLAASVAAGAPPFYGTGTLNVPAYAGYDKGRFGKGSAVQESDIALLPVPGLAEAPVRLLFWVPMDVMRIGASYNTLFLALGAGLVGLIAVLSAARLSTRLTRPLGALADAAERVIGGDLDVNVPLDGDRETARLGVTFALMLRTLREMTADQAGRNEALSLVNEELVGAMHRLEVAQGQLVQAGKLAAVGTLVAGLSHELNNPIAVIVGYVQGLLRTTPPSAPAHAGLVAIQRQAQRCAALVRTLLDFSRDRPPHREETPIAEILDRVEQIAGSQAKHAGVSLVREPLDPDLPPAELAPEEITSALLNLVSNGIDATPGGGRVTVSAYPAEENGRPGVELVVADEGTGIAPDVLPHVFDAFFTTKPPGRGTGLGLPLARQIAEAHGGRMALDTRPGAGTKARLWLPLSAATFSERKTAPRQASVAPVPS